LKIWTPSPHLPDRLETRPVFKGFGSIADETEAAGLLGPLNEGAGEIQLA